MKFEEAQRAFAPGPDAWRIPRPADWPWTAVPFPADTRRPVDQQIDVLRRTRVRVTIDGERVFDEVAADFAVEQDGAFYSSEAPESARIAERTEVGNTNNREVVAAVQLWLRPLCGLAVTPARDARRRSRSRSIRNRRRRG